MKLREVSPTEPIKEGVIYRVVAVPSSNTRALLRMINWIPIVNQYVKEFVSGKIAEKLEKNLRDNGFELIDKRIEKLDEDPFIRIYIDVRKPKYVYSAVPPVVSIIAEIVVVSLAILIATYVLSFAVERIYEVVGKGVAGIEGFFRKYGGYLLGGILLFYGIQLRKEEVEASRFEKLLMLELLGEAG